MTASTLRSDVMRLATQLIRENPDLRDGQAAFNALRILRPSLADSIRGTLTADPFYDDARLDTFWASLEQPNEVIR